MALFRSGPCSQSPEVLDAHLGYDLMLNVVSSDGDVDLDANCILGLTPKPLDIEVLLHPREEPLYLPSAFVKDLNF